MAAQGVLHALLPPLCVSASLALLRHPRGNLGYGQSRPEAPKQLLALGLREGMQVLLQWHWDCAAALEAWPDTLLALSAVGLQPWRWHGEAADCEHGPAGVLQAAKLGPGRATYCCLAAQLPGQEQSHQRLAAAWDGYGAGLA